MAARKKAARDRRERMIGVKVSETEHEEIRQAAFKARKSLGAFLRDLALGAPEALDMAQGHIRKIPKK